MLHQSAAHVVGTIPVGGRLPRWRRPRWRRRGWRRRCGSRRTRTSRRRWQRGNKTQITLSISPRLLERVDEVAHRKEVSRAALLTFRIPGDAVDREAA